MPASVQIVQLSGTVVGGGTMGTSTAPSAATEDKTSGTLRFQRVDTLDETSYANAIPVPPSGQNYSMRVPLCMYIASGTFDQISNPRWYSDGTNGFGTGRKLWYKMHHVYVQPSIPTESNDPPQFPGGENMVNWFDTTSGSPADGDAANGGVNAGPYNSAGLPKYVGDIINFVFEVEATSTQGVTDSESVVLSWDEI